MRKKKFTYRPNVAVFVLNRHGEILTCERSDRRGAWQLPQGGIEEGENVREAALRELMEEIGTTSGKIISVLPKTINYDWPERLWRKGFRGQAQRYVIFALSPWAKIDLKRAFRKKLSPKCEFRNYTFLDPKTFLSHISGFKRKAYRKALKLAILKHPNYFS